MKSVYIGRLAMAALACAGMLGHTRNASALTYVNYELHGQDCYTQNPNSSTQPYYSQYCISTNSSSSMNVTCPLTLPSQNYTYGYIALTGYNRNSNASTSCTLYATDPEGNNLLGATASLTANQSNYQVQSASFSPPLGDLVFVSCTIAGHTGSGGNGNSWVSSIFLQLGY